MYTVYSKKSSYTNAATRCSDMERSAEGRNITNVAYISQKAENSLIFY